MYSIILLGTNVRLTGLEFPRSSFQHFSWIGIIPSGTGRSPVTEGRNARRLQSSRSPQRNNHHLGILPSIKVEAGGLSFWSSLQVIRFAVGLKCQGTGASPGAWCRLGAAGRSLQLCTYISLPCCQHSLPWQVLQASSSIERSCSLWPPPGAHGSRAAPALDPGMLSRSLDC